ncbi:hypothetical protein, partial [Streptomyces sp. CC53]|uniref:hypothetical protein n=1 Tax=Streptomyces sp. CC53 TaxID=1906740 RepID=UPI001C43525B
SVSGSDFVSGGRWRAFAFRLIRLYQILSGPNFFGSVSDAEESSAPACRLIDFAAERERD